MALPVLERIDGRLYTVETLSRRDYSDTAHNIIVREHPNGTIQVVGTRRNRRAGTNRRVWSWDLPDRTDRVKISTIYDVAGTPRKMIEAQSAYIVPDA